MPANRNRNPRGYGRMNMNNSNQNSGGQDFGSGGNRTLLASSGPLMTNHLQLHELDLELALLKRKREMIEKQHTMLVSDNHFGGSTQYGFNQAPQSYSQRSEPTRNFANFYNDGSGPQYDRFNTQQGVKRPAIDPWDNSTPKRFNGPSGPKKPARYEPRPPRSQPARQPPPLMSSSFRQRRPAPVATRTNFKPAKVTKPRQNTAPNKLNSYPVADRKNLVGKASGLVQKTPETFVYEADKPANPKLLGRLELALGSILRDMREQYGTVEPHVLTFVNISGQRAIKQVIRERIRTIMLGKPVGAGAEIVALYRMEHPKDTDIELLDKARESIVQKGNLAIEIIKQGNPERYFRNNFRRLLDISLNEMFERMQKLYNNVEETDKPLQEIIDGMLLDIQKSLQDESKEGPEENIEINDSQVIENTETEKSEENAAEVDEAAVKSDVNDTENVTNQSQNENDIKSKDNAAVSEDIAAKSEDIAAKSKDIAAKSEDIAAKSEDIAAKSEDNAVKPEDNAAKAEDNAAQSEENADKSTQKTPAENAAEVAQNGAGKLTRVTSREEFVRAKFYNRLMDTLMKRNLPIILPKYKEFIMRILNTENAFKETKAYLIKSTNEKVDEIAANKSATTPTKTLTGSKDKKSLFVKILGRPGLPKKKLMKAFLDTFHPTLIKKHRNMHNILFVSFDSQENFENILAKNGEVIANCRLDIRISERINKAKTDSQTENNDQQDAKPNNDNDVEIVDSNSEPIKLDESLDDQITDLLSSIREEEEKKVDVPENEGEVNPEIKNEDGPTIDSEEDMLLAEPVNGVEKQDEEMAANTEADKTAPEPVQKDVEAAKNEANAKGTPTRSSARLTSTPSTIRTRRASKLSQNN